MEIRPYIFRKAALADLSVIMEIIHDGQISIGKLGIDQWQDNYPQVDVMQRDIIEGNAFVLCDYEHVICTATVILTGEPTYNKIYAGQWLTDKDNYSVIHRMSVLEKYKKIGIAYYMINEIEKYCVMKNIQSIRIDTHEGNLPMQKLIGKCGFSYCGVIYLLSGNKRIAFEKIL